MIDGDHWNFPAYLGMPYVSQYFLMLRWLNRPSHFDLQKFEILLSNTQLPDGSWFAVKDANLSSGDLNATVFNYWALKVLKGGSESESLRRAKLFILNHGGLDRTSVLTKVFLALFGNYPWASIKRVPLVLFRENFLINESHFAQWVSPHLMPIAYLTHFPVTKVPSPEFKLDELETNLSCRLENDEREIFNSADWLIRKLIARQQPRGSWGGYTLATLLSIVVLESCQDRTTLSKHQIDSYVNKGYALLERLYLQSGSSAYLGVTIDGRYWDTALVLAALKDSGESSPELERAGDFIVSNQQPNGGIPFGEDFWYAPDTDDTALSIMGLGAFPKFRPAVSKAVRWLQSMQNDDGGWGAFDRNNQPTKLLSEMVKDFADSVEFFDPSSADVTAHILEALGSLGYRMENSATIRRAIAYLENTQDPVTGTWRGRWGINYLYGTSASITGLIAVGYPSSHSRIRRAVEWLESRQNADGGFGETSASYLDKIKAGVGISTPTQTAWALLGLVASTERGSPAIERAVHYLLSEFQKNGLWKDGSAVGTGHPGIVYMEYPSYPYAFPLMALGRYTNKIKAAYHNHSHR